MNYSALTWDLSFSVLVARGKVYFINWLRRNDFDLSVSNRWDIQSPDIQ